MNKPEKPKHWWVNGIYCGEMDTPHGLPAFKKAADEITRLQAKVERLTKRGLQDLNWQNDELHEENERLRELLKGVLDAASPQKRWDVLMLEIEKELANE